MDTRDEEEWTKVIDSVQELWNQMLDSSNSVLKAVDTFENELRVFLEDTTPKLTIPASKEDCLQKVRLLVSVIEQTRETWQTMKVKVVECLQSQHDRIEDISYTWRGSYASQVYGENYRRLKSINDDLILHLEDLQTRKTDLVYFYGAASETFVQTCMFNMMQGQEEDVKEWFEDEVMSQFGKHVKVAKPEKNEGVELDVDVPRASPKRHVPSEIVSLIYSSADLETCVALREINSQWYSVFHNLDELWKTKMGERNPWMMPGDGDLETWQDVVLVFVKRLTSDLWKRNGTSTSNDNMDVTGANNDNPRKTVVAKELKYGEKFPSTFVPLTDSSACDSGTCEHMHVLGIHTQRKYLMDLWTMESRRHPEEFDVVSRGQEETIIRLVREDVEIILPSFLFTQNILFTFSVRLYRSVVCFRIEGGGILVMPRDKPHHENAVTFLEPHDLFEVGDQFFSKQSDGYYLVNFTNKTQEKYYSISDSTKAFPAASYNGLIWLQVPEKKCLVPTFIDLQARDGEQLCYRPDRTIMGTSFGVTRCSHGSKSRDLDQFVVGFSETGTDVVDLVEGTITHVRSFFERPGINQVFVGFNKGIFQARCMYRKAVFRTRNRIFREHGIRVNVRDEEEEEEEEEQEEL